MQSELIDEPTSLLKQIINEVEKMDIEKKEAVN